MKRIKKKLRKLQCDERSEKNYNYIINKPLIKLNSFKFSNYSFNSNMNVSNPINFASLNKQ